MGCLSVVYMTNRSDIDMRFGPFKFRFCHFVPPKILTFSITFKWSVKIKI